VCHDDGVAALLQNHNFQCVFDQLQQVLGDDQQSSSFSATTFALPPSTHWSGTTIDYSYSRNIPVHGVYVSPAGYSDHRMTVCDWKLPDTGNMAVKTKAKTHSVLVVDAMQPASDSEATTTTTTTTMESCSDSDNRIKITATTATSYVGNQESAETWLVDDTSWSSSYSGSDTSRK
jgi:hypothetical protein